MAITETRVKTRTDITVPFFNQTDLLPHREDGSPVTADLIAQGKYNRETTYSEDGLTETTVTTHASLESLSEADTLLGLELDAACWDYIVVQDHGHSASSYVLAGIDQPFTVTIKYQFPKNIVDDTEIQHIVAGMQEDAAVNTPKVTGLTVTDDAIEIVYAYADCAEYQTSWMNDMPWTTRLYAAGAHRTINYKLAE